MGESKSKGGTEASGGREVKRQRVSRACNRCRIARQKCDGERPSCGSCASANVQCTYVAGTKRRGIQSGYIRTIELALSWCVTNVPGCEDSLKTLLRSESGRQLLSNSEAESAAKLLHRWRKTTICKGIDRLLSGSQLDTPIADEDDEEEDRQLHGEPSMLDVDFEHITNTHRSTGGNLEFPSSTLIRDDNMGQMVGQTASLVSDGIQVPLLPDNFTHLVDVYFAYTHCWLPIVSKESILKLCYTYPEDGLNISSTTPGAGAFAELWSILAFASFQTQYVRGSTEGIILAQRMMNFAQDLIPKDFAAFERGHASSLLLLTLFNIGIDEFPSAWVTVGIATRVILLLRQKLELLGPQTIATTQDRQNGLNPLLLACFVLDTFLSLQLNTTSHLRSQDVPTELLSEEGLDEWQPWTACPEFVSSGIDTQPKRSTPMLSNSIFNQFVRLSLVLNDSIASVTQTTTPEDALLDWTRQMPSKIRGLYSISENEPTPHRLNLLLAFLVAKAICNPQDRHVSIDKALSVFEVYAQTLGNVVTPPTFTLFASILQRDEDMDSLRRHRLNDVKSQIRIVWENASPSPASTFHGTNQAVTHSIPPQLTSPFSPNSHQQQPPSTTSVLHTTSPLSQESLQLNKGIHPVAMEDFNSFSDSQFPPMNMPDAAPQSLYDNRHLEAYNSNNSMDLDALFEDLTSFDGEHQSSHPAFMRNLGFAANSNLTDLMTGGFGWSHNPP